MPQNSIPQQFSHEPPLAPIQRVTSARYPEHAEVLQRVIRRVADAQSAWAYAVGQLNKAREWRSDHTAGNREWPRERVRVRAYIRDMRIECDRLRQRAVDACAVQAELVARMFR